MQNYGLVLISAILIEFGFNFLTSKPYLLLLEALEVVFVFNELVFAPIVEVIVAKECERPE